MLIMISMCWEATPIFIFLIVCVSSLWFWSVSGLLHLDGPLFLVAHRAVELSSTGRGTPFSSRGACEKLGQRRGPHDSGSGSGLCKSDTLGKATWALKGGFTERAGQCMWHELQSTFTTGSSRYLNPWSRLVGIPSISNMFQAHDSWYRVGCGCYRQYWPCRRKLQSCNDRAACCLQP